MDVWRITVAALRRWYVLLPLLALTGFATVTVGDSVRPQYEVTSTVILVPGSADTDVPSPYGGMTETTEVLSIVLNNPGSRHQIEELGLNRDYVTVARTRSSIIDVSVLSDTPEESLATADAVLEMASQELAERQGDAGIPSRAQLTVQVLQAPSVSDVVSDGKMRNMAIVGIVGAAISLLVAVLFDDIVGLIRRWVGRRRDRRASKQDMTNDGAAETGPQHEASDAEARERREYSTDEAGMLAISEDSGRDGAGRRSTKLAEAGRDE